MKIRTANLCYQYDNVWVEITDIPLYAYLVPEISGIVCGWLGSRVCTPFEWAYDIHWGPQDEDGYTEKSLGHLWFMAGQKIHLAFHSKEERVAKIPVTHEWVRENWPGLENDVDEMADGRVQL